MADAKFTQNTSSCHSLQALTALPTLKPVMFFDPAANTLDLVDTATHRLGAAQKLLELTASCHLQDADSQALGVVSEAAYLLLSDGYDLFQALTARALEPAGEN
ncbi:hypothetical protein [Marinimicrobium locisalis]|uniref:hypothetical protein n=1 Tax=Marinimicrobium locisalis TaxID=546022 RepID=UPI0032222166